MQADNPGLTEYAVENNERWDQQCVSCMYKLAPGNMTKAEPLVCLKEMHKKPHFRVYFIALNGLPSACLISFYWSCQRGITLSHMRAKTAFQSSSHRLLNATAEENKTVGTAKGGGGGRVQSTHLRAKFPKASQTSQAAVSNQRQASEESKGTVLISWMIHWRRARSPVATEGWWVINGSS